MSYSRHNYNTDGCEVSCCTIEWMLLQDGCTITSRLLSAQTALLCLLSARDATVHVAVSRVLVVICGCTLVV